MASDLPMLTRVVGGAEENWVKSTAGGTGIAVFGALFNRAIDTQHLSSVVQELLDCYSILRVQIVENAKGKTCFQASESCTAFEYVHERPWPSVEGFDHTGVIMFPKDHHDKHGSLALHKLVTEELNVAFVNAEGKPSPPVRVFQVLVYHSHSKHQTVVLLKLHSGALDRRSGHTVVEEFLGKLNLAVEGRLHHSQSAMSNEGLLAPIEDFIPKGKASKGLLQKGVDVVGYAYNSKKYALLPFDANYNGASKTPFESKIVGVNLGKQGTVSFFEACKRENVSWAAALAAALLKTTAALKELKEKKQDEFNMTIVMDCRQYLEPKLPEAALGNYTLGIPGGEKVKEGIEFWDLARQVNSSIEKDLSKSKQFSEMSVLGMLFSQVMKHPNITPKSSLRTALFNLFVDPPMEAQWKGVGELGLVGTIGPFSSMHFVGPCFCVVETLTDGPELLLSLVYPSPVFSQAQILEILQPSINLLLESCGH
ncbi:hypothetical protein GOP47_0026043 [Adiantum capillus-veneris]|uniref:Phthiocerol/phthiodiolone dimycocerosyl transferase C-terminal domain-containing protein n=1 Tax=Adiantum capillus-veneris TaxID=13818 RepID=A0A9D4Z3F1_ADICA|nr:hypothetical protein GOP47_0025537 [Adiantum capillus-veneris]KAI5059724.1 hypothetical protein GOP47_0026043 [Adiantum capillus-veneris]